MTKKKFLVLGIGNAQYDLIKFLKDNTDYEVHSLSNTADGPGRAVSDFFEIVDIVNRDDVLKYAREKRIDFVYSVGSDVAMPTASWVSEQLELPRLVSSEIATVCNNKHLLRERLQYCYGAVPFQALKSDLKVENIEFPAIVKPVDSQGQRGVSSVSSSRELGKAREFAVAHSRSSGVIIENKIDGPEISVNCFIVKGNIAFLLISDREVWPEFDGGVVRKHIIPSSISDLARLNVTKLVESTVSELAIQEGPVYFQIKLNADQPYLIEVTPRLDGCHMWKLILQSTGVNLLDATVERLRGNPVEIPQSHTARAGFIEFICQPPESVFEPTKEHLVLDNVQFYYEPGQKVRRMNGKMEKCGYYISESES